MCCIYQDLPYKKLKVRHLKFLIHLKITKNPLYININFFFLKNNYIYFVSGKGSIVLYFTVLIPDFIKNTAGFFASVFNLLPQVVLIQVY